MNEMNIIELDQKITNCAVCNIETPILYSIPMYEGKKVDITKTDEWAGMPICKVCFYNDALIRGRTFGIKGNIRKAVVLNRNKIMVTWSFLNDHEPAEDTVKAITEHSDGIYDIQMDFLLEVEKLKKDAHESIVNVCSCSPK